MRFWLQDNLTHVMNQHSLTMDTNSTQETATWALDSHVNTSCSLHSRQICLPSLFQANSFFAVDSFLIER